jgi:SAM-dependent methyltransferase
MPAAAQNLPDAKSLENDSGTNLDICQCSGCGLVQMNTEPVSYYREVIRAAGFSPEMKDFRIKQFGEFVRKNSLKGKKVVEIGCGRGEYLNIMRQCGVDSYGIEYGDDSVSQCVKDGLKVFKGFIEDENNRIEKAPFDAFFILSFLEHLPDPNSALRGIYNNLADDAVGIVEVPNFDMILRNKLFSEFMRDHLFYFTRESLGVALSLNGFEIISCGEVWHDYIISATVKKRGRTDLSSFSNHRAKIEKEIRDYIGRFNKVAIWGAGHQAFAIMSMFDLGGKIRYVVDSAPFKQGKYTPATHTPIVARDTLRTDPVDAVIIIAGGYSDEVKKIINEKFDENLNIAVLRDSGLELHKKINKGKK